MATKIRATLAQIVWLACALAALLLTGEHRAPTAAPDAVAAAADLS